jgi:hypothetical protein
MLKKIAVSMNANATREYMVAEAEIGGGGWI